MRILACFLTLFVFAATSNDQASAQESKDWVPVTAKGELRQLLSDKIFVAKKDWVLDYYRSDGAMAYFNTKFNTVSIRKWVVEGDGKVCYYIYVKPDKLLECAIYSQSKQDPETVRIEVVSGHVKGAKIVGTLSGDAPPANVLEAVHKTAGPAK